MKKVIFDTDVGIDDAMALLFLHYSSEVDLQAITTGFGNASIENTTRNTLFLKEKFDINVPVFKGAARPYKHLSDENFQNEYPDFVHGKNGLGDIDIIEPTSKLETLSAAEGIVKLVKEKPNEISIVAVGRLTNLALALDLCPELPNLVKELVVMGGAFGFNNHHGNVTAVAEANVWGDAYAANYIFNAGFNTSIVGLDVSEETIADDDYFANIESNSGEAGNFIRQISHCYLEFHRSTRGVSACPIHDSSAVAYLLRPEYYTTQKAKISVELEGDDIGKTSALLSENVQDGYVYYCQICTEVNPAKVLDLYKEVLTRSAYKKC